MKKEIDYSINHINEYLHIYYLLKTIQKMPFDEPDYDYYAELMRLVKRARVPKDRRSYAILHSYKEINNVEIERFQYLDPFRTVQWAMNYIWGGKIVINKNGSRIRKPAKRRGKPINWAYDFLLFALVNDMCLLQGQPYYKQVNDKLNDYHILDDANHVGDTDALRKRFEKIRFYDSDGIMDVLQYLYDACNDPKNNKDFVSNSSLAGMPFLPKDTVIQELPIDTLVDIADSLGIKLNKYLRAEEPLPEEYLARIKKYKIYQKNSNQII